MAADPLGEEKRGCWGVVLGEKSFPLALGRPARRWEDGLADRLAAGLPGYRSCPCVPPSYCCGVLCCTAAEDMFCPAASADSRHLPHP